MVYNMPEELVELLEEHGERLTFVQNWLYDLATSNIGEMDQDSLNKLNLQVKFMELWMQSQVQQRVTALELKKQVDLRNAALNEQQSRKPARK
jgi:hypothetical protein